VPVSSDDIEAIARIAELNSSSASDHPWAGRSLTDLLTLTDYRRLRPGLAEQQLADWLDARPDIASRWVGWSEDKRTSGGFYLRRLDDDRWQIGSLSSPSTTEYTAKSAAVAAYILRELDYWATPADERS
jgi:hypothetical protein